MKKILEWIRDCAIVLMLLVILPGIVGGMESHYTREATVIEVTDTEIVVKDTCGFEWSFYEEDYNVGDDVKLKMFDCHTSSIYDDEIVKVKKIEKTVDNKR